MPELYDVTGARLFALSILAMAFLATVFVRYRGRLGAGLQHAAIWGLIFAGLIIAYGFSDVLERELTAAPMVAQDATAVALRRAPDGHFHAPLVVNGQRIDALVDTGASALVLSRADAARAGVNIADLVYSSPAYSANGVVYSAPVTLSDVRLGPFEDRGVPAMVSGGDMEFSLLGMAYLDRFRRFSVEGDRMVIER
jgi:aspartyl protease family protein